MPIRLSGLLAIIAVTCCAMHAQLATKVSAQEKTAPLRGSIVEDRAAKKLIEAGDARYERFTFHRSGQRWTVWRHVNANKVIMC